MFVRLLALSMDAHNQLVRTLDMSNYFKNNKNMHNRFWKILLVVSYQVSRIKMLGEHARREILESRVFIS